MKKDKIYLAGSFYDFRDKIISELPELTFDDPRKNRQYCISATVEDDMKKASKDKVLLACFPKGKSRGTMTYAEIGASRAKGNFVMIADENEEKDELLSDIADVNFDSINEAISYLKKENNDLKSYYDPVAPLKKLGDIETIVFAGNKKQLEKLNLPKFAYSLDNLFDPGHYPLSCLENVDLTIAHFPKKGDWDRKQIFFMGASYALQIPVILLDEKEVPYPPLLGLARRVFTTKRSLRDYIGALESNTIEKEAGIMYNLFKKYDKIN